MKKAGAITIIITMALGLCAWAGTNIISNKVKIAKIETREMSQSELLKEVRDDVKKILRRK
jgi:hypothetical protein